MGAAAGGPGFPPVSPSPHNGGMRTTALAVAALLAAPAAAEEAPPKPSVERFTLGNGLRATLRPLAGAKSAAVAVLYDFGEDADPEGKSGLAHLCEHLYFTAAAGGAKGRTVEEIVKAYPAGWNAQTGWNYTLFSTVAPAERLDAELRDAAARMGDLKPVQGDLDREVPRIVDELENMYGRMPALAASNHGRVLLAPGRPGRKGGVPAEVRGIALADVAKAFSTRYRPRNARLTVAGPFDAAALRKGVEALFGGIPAGEAPAARPLPAPPPAKAPLEVLKVEVPPDASGTGAQACIGWRTPSWRDEGAAEFLVLAVRLMVQNSRAEADPRMRPRVLWAPLDEPDHLFVQAGIGKDETPEAAVARLEAFVAAILDRPDANAAMAKSVFGPMLGTLPDQDALLAVNPYLAAFAPGRREQLGIDGPALARALDAVTTGSLAKARARWFSGGVAVAVLPR